MKIQVECYSGHKANGRPIKFWISESVLFVESIEDQWRGIDGNYFRVRADDGNMYVLCYIEASDTWVLRPSSR
jgi:hypothetical protein